MSRIFVLTAVSVLGLCWLGQAAWQDERRDDERAPLTAERFVLIASASGMAEVEAGKVAAEKATSEEVKKFAKMLVEDHTKANKQLTQIAETKQIPVARDMDRKQQEMIKKLSQLTGAEFDREYIMAMVKSHEKGVALFTKFSEEGKDSELKSFATQTLPTLKDHFKMAKEIAEKVK